MSSMLEKLTNAHTIYYTLLLSVDNGQTDGWEDKFSNYVNLRFGFTGRIRVKVQVLGHANYDLYIIHAYTAMQLLWKRLEMMIDISLQLNH